LVFVCFYLVVDGVIFWQQKIKQRRNAIRVAWKLSDHSIYLRVSRVYIHEITQGLLPRALNAHPYPCVTWKVPAWSQV
jgi:hypothetical protein